MSSVKSFVRGRPQIVFGLVAVLAVIVAFAAGIAVGDESGKVAELEDQEDEAKQWELPH